MRPASHWVAWLAVALAAGCAGSAAGQTQDNVVKAVYLVRFAAFVEWPPDSFATPQAPLVICVAGRSQVAPALQAAVQNQTANGRPLQARNLAESSAARGCHIVYLGLGGAAMVAGMPDETPVLRVTDASITTRPGMIHFENRNGRVRFHVDQVAARQADLRFSSRLLAFALSVRRTR